MTPTPSATLAQPATPTPSATLTGPRPAAARLTIAEAAERTGLTTHTLRYYERDGLMLRAVERTSSGHRAYGEGDLVWITLLTCLRATGMPIREVKVYAELVRSGEGNELVRLDLLQSHRARVLAQLAEVTSHLGAIDNKIGVYTAKLEAAGLDFERAATG
ncbi:MerR family transcriptional regulator [Lapillicoccus sp.]|uniref:MerR family transcriptional regulator n=1 Tax=Lapillicoccus sp. TaxID=1909287 RepID=UPI0025CFFA5A|nr:MerR family transcriptional regulator [Lapillicoccus sp.]